MTILQPWKQLLEHLDFLNICVQVRHFGSKCLFKRHWEFGIVWKGYVWRLQFQIQKEYIYIIYVNITTLK